MRQTLTLSLVLFSLLLSAAQADDSFPLRPLFPGVTTIELNTLHEQRDNMLIVDVRSDYEYQTLHIKGALHIPADESEFIENLRDLRENDSRTLVFYCNGHSCRKSYEASVRANQAGIHNHLTFDAGVFDWAKAYPQEAVLLGQALSDGSRLIGQEKQQQHMLEPEAFATRARHRDSIVLDIRDNSQKDGINLFPMRQHSVALDNERLASFVHQAKNEGKTLLIYDAVGRQVSWLQYFLEAEGLKDYYFMRGGAREFLAFR